MGRTIAGSGAPALTEDVPLPEAVEDLLGTRVAQLDGARAQAAARARARLRPARVAGSPRSRTTPCSRTPSTPGVVVVEGDRVRPAHPLLAAAAKSGSRARDRRALHLALAEVAGGPGAAGAPPRARDTLPDERARGDRCGAAAGASARGAAQQAVVLAEHALRLTPRDSAVRSERLLELAGYLEVAGERQRVTDLLDPELDSLSRRDRIRAWLRLAEGGTIGSCYDTEAYLDLALAASEDDPELHA